MLVLEVHEDHGVDWWLSFTSNNPEPEDAIKCPDEEFAFKIWDLFEKHCVMKNLPNHEECAT